MSLFSASSTRLPARGRAAVELWVGVSSGRQRRLLGNQTPEKRFETDRLDQPAVAILEQGLAERAPLERREQDEVAPAPIARASTTRRWVACSPKAQSTITRSASVAQHWEAQTPHLEPGTR